MNIREFIYKVNEKLFHKNGIIAIVYESNGSTPTEIGRMMFIDNENTFGSIGGGIAEKKAIDKARKMLQKGEKIAKIHIDLTGRKNSDGLCGGEADILLINTIYKAPLILIGAGHVNQAIKELAEQLGYDVWIYDVRNDLPWHNYKKIKNYDEIFADYVKNPFIVIATHNHEEDERSLYAILKNKVHFRYLGIVSSKRKFNIMKNNIEKKDVKVPSNIYSPAGLNLNGNEPIEVALSIVAQIEKIYYNKDGKDLKDVR